MEGEFPVGNWKANNGNCLGIAALDPQQRRGDFVRMLLRVTDPQSDYSMHQ